MNELLNIMQQQAMQAAKLRATTRTGIIRAYDPDQYAVKVEMQPTGEITGWMPLGSPWVGDSWGLFFGPALGDTVEMEFPLGILEAGLVSSRFFNNERKPLSVPSGEAWLVHKTGSLFKFKNDGTVELTSQDKLKITAGNGADIEITGDVTMNVQGAVNATVSNGVVLNGSLTVNGMLTTAGLAVVGGFGTPNVAEFQVAIDSTQDITAGGVSLKTHRHSGIQPGLGTSGPPV